MGLEVSNGKVTFVNIKEGKLYTKAKGEEPVYFNAISGVINGVKFEKETYQGKDYEKALITLTDNGERYILQMNTESGYFRGFCNSLKSGDPKLAVRISPSSKVENDKPKTTCFVSQNGKALKHAYTINNMGNLPQVEKVTFKGKDQWDGTKQIEFWKNWLLSINFDNTLMQHNEMHNNSVDAIN